MEDKKNSRNGSINTLPRNQIHLPLLGKSGSATVLTALINEAIAGGGVLCWVRAGAL
jgi:hypothetical protein